MTKDDASVSGDLVFAPNTRVQSFSVSTFNDHQVEGDETLDMTLFDSINADLGWKYKAPLYIQDDDQPNPAMIDDFEGGLPLGMQTSGGVTVTVQKVISPSDLAVPGQYLLNNVLNVTYTIPAAVQRNLAPSQVVTDGFVNSFETSRDWSAYDGFSFWFYGTNSGNTMTVKLLDNQAVDPGPSGWDVVWRDEFDGPAGAAANPANWGYDIGGEGWGNREWQYYTDERENSALSGDSSLIITATTENTATTSYQCAHTPPDHEPGPCAFTSARLLTQDKFEFAYGRAEARLKVPYGQGIWPAFWSLGNNFPEVGWPNSGEIDIMENIGREPNTVHGTVHGPGYSGGSGIGGGHTLDEALSADFHVFAIEWEPEIIRWYIDDTNYFTLTDVCR